MICIILHREAKTLVAGSNSCEVTRSTVQVVDGCPDSEEKWKERAAIKNCAANASQCAEPERLVYHCVINSYVNQTIEVCAYAQNIVLGQCTSYFSSGNVIQENWGTDCSKFKENACPIHYRSDEAHKYPGCYNLTKKLTASTRNPMFTSHPDTTAVSTTTSSSMSTDKHVEMPGKEEKMDTNTATIIGIIVGVLFAVTVTVVFIVFVVRKRNRKDSRGRQPLEISKTDEDRPLNAEQR